MAIRISLCGDEHVQGLDALWGQCRPEDLPGEANGSGAPVPEHFRATLLLVASVGTEVIGSIAAGYDGHRGWLYGLAVSPAYRFDKVAANLVMEAEKELRILGCAKINLLVRDSDFQVQQFYKKMGYATEERVSMAKRLEFS